jgi:hypothetical protein
VKDVLKGKIDEVILVNGCIGKHLHRQLKCLGEGYGSIGAVLPEFSVIHFQLLIKGFAVSS